MAKYRKKKEKKGKLGTILFVLFMFIYAGAALYGISYGLRYLWDYMDAYEQSRYKHTVNAYMEKLNAAYITDSCDDLIAQVDHHIQPEEECRRIIEEAIGEEITHAKKASECTDTHLAYVIQAKKRVIGTVTFDAVTEDEYGFPQWEFTGDSFDMSYLIGESVGITAPHDYPVYVNGAKLDERYITESGIRYEALDGYYEDYDLPTMSTYAAGPCLGELELVVKDLDGNTVVIDENTDMNEFVHNCTDREREELDTLIESFLGRYVIFTGGANKTRKDQNLQNLLVYIVPGSKLAGRMKNALDGLTYAQSKNDVIQDITVHHYVNFGGGRYMCDLTYLVDTTGREGVVQTTNNVRMIILETADGLKAESMTSY